MFGLPPRATFSPAHPLARRDVPLTRASTFLSCAFREHRKPTDTHIPSPSSNPPSPFRGVAEAALYCAHRTSTF